MIVRCAESGALALNRKNVWGKGKVGMYVLHSRYEIDHMYLTSLKRRGDK